MSTTSHILETTWPYGCDDVEIEVGFTFEPGDRGDPIGQAPDTADITSVFIVENGSRRPASAAMIQAISVSDRIYREMIARALDELTPDPDATRDTLLDEALP